MNPVNRYSLCVITGGLILTLTPFAQAQAPAQRPPGLPDLEIVADYGGEPARPYYVAIKGADVEEQEGYSPQMGPQSHPTEPYGEQDMLPVESEQLTPGQVVARNLDLPGGFTPIFVIGDDALSRQWLDQRGDILRDMNAVGLVVQVENEQGLQALRHAAKGLELRPVAGDGLAERLGLQHYPALISQHGIEQ